MQNRNLIRMMAMLVLMAIVLSSAACGNKNANSDVNITEPTRLTVEKVPVCYTDEQTEIFSTRLTEIAAKAVFLLKSIRLNESQTQDVRVYIKDYVLPMLETKSITTEELTKLCKKAEIICNVTEEAPAQEAANNNSDEFSVALYTQLYRECLLVLGTERAGTLAYESVLIWVDHKIGHYWERYQKYGYLYYLEYIDNLEQQRLQFTQTVGEATFSQMLSLMFFGTSLVSLVTEDALNTDQEMLLNDAELLQLLNKHKIMLQINQPTKTQWEVCFSLFAEWTETAPPLLSSWNDLQKAEWKAFWNVENVGSFGQICAESMILYQVLIEKLEEDDIAELRNENKEARVQTICMLLTECGEAFEHYTETLSSIHIETDKEKNVLEKQGVWEEYLLFQDSLSSIEASDLRTAIQEYAKSPTEERYARVKEYTKASLHGMYPYLTFVFLWEGEISTS